MKEIRQKVGVNDENQFRKKCLFHSLEREKYRISKIQHLKQFSRGLKSQYFVGKSRRYIKPPWVNESSTVTRSEIQGICSKGTWTFRSAILKQVKEPSLQKNVSNHSKHSIEQHCNDFSHWRGGHDKLVYLDSLNFFTGSHYLLRESIFPRKFLLQGSHYFLVYFNWGGQHLQGVKIICYTG